MRELIALECGSCKRKNYYFKKNRRNHSGKFVFNKFCKACRKYTKHKEAKA